MNILVQALFNKKLYTLAHRVNKVMADDIADAIEDLRKTAGKKSLSDFIKYFGDVSNKFFKKKKEAEFRRRLATEVLHISEKEIGIIGKDLWFAFNEMTPILYQKGKVTVEALSDNVLKRIGSVEKKIINDLADYTNKIAGRKIHVSIGEQWVSIGSPGSFRVSVPDTKDPIDMIFPYNIKIIPALKKMEDIGIPKQWLWAATDWFHELAHALGIDNEKKADTYSFNQCKKFFSKRYPKVKEITLISRKVK